MLAWERPAAVLRRAHGDKGLWRLLHRGRRWELSLQRSHGLEMVTQGVFGTEHEAAGHAQLLEDETHGDGVASR